MKTEVIIEALKTRIDNLDGNPTKKHLTNEVIKALERLKKYEEKYGELKS